MTHIYHFYSIYLQKQKVLVVQGQCNKMMRGRIKDGKSNKAKDKDKRNACIDDVLDDSMYCRIRYD